MAETKGLTIELSADLKKFDSAIKGAQKSLNSTQKELRAVDKSLKFNPGNVTLLKQKFDLLKNAVTQNEQKLAKLQEKQKKMDAAGVDKTSAEYRNLEREIIKTENQLDTAKRKLKEFGSVGAQQVAAVGEKFKTFGAKATAAGKTLTTRVTAPIVAMGAVSAKKFAEVDKTMQLTNSTMGNTAKEADLINKAMKSAAAESTFGMEDAATATLNFARAGLKAEAAASTLAPAMALAAGEGGELDTVSAGLVATINGFGDDFANAGKYADVFANACNNSALEINKLSESMSVAAPIFSSAGYSVKDASLYLGIMGDKGIEADKAANSLKTGLARLIDPAKQGAEKMAELGLYTDEGGSALENLDGSMKSTTEVQAILHDSFAKLSESEQVAAASAIFGKNQMAPWLALINTAPERVQELSTALDQEGTAMKMQSDMMSGFGGSIEQLKSGVDVLATSFGEALAPMLQPVINGLQFLTDKFNALSPTAQRIVAVLAILVAALGPVLLIVGAFASSIGAILTTAPLLAAAFTAAGPAMAGAFSALLGPVGLAIAAVTAAVAAGIWLYKNWDKVKATLTKIVNTIKATFIRVFTAVKTRISSIFNGLRTTVTNVVTGIKNRVVNVFSGMKSKVATIFNGVRDAVKKPIDKAKEIIQGLRDKVKGIFDKIKISFPHVPLPHFTIHPEGWKLKDLLEGKIPSLSVDIHRDAMQSGKILRGFTPFGMVNGRIQAGGEVGREAVVGANTLSGLVKGAVMRGINNSVGTLAGAIAVQNALASGGGPQTIILENYLYKNGPSMGREIVYTYDTWKGRLG